MPRYSGGHKGKEEDRKAQNRKAQQRFRAKRAKLEEEDKRRYAALSSQYEALIAENERLKRQYEIVEVQPQVQSTEGLLESCSNRDHVSEWQRLDFPSLSPKLLSVSGSPEPSLMADEAELTALFTATSSPSQQSSSIAWDDALTKPNHENDVATTPDDGDSAPCPTTSNDLFVLGDHSTTQVADFNVYEPLLPNFHFPPMNSNWNAIAQPKTDVVQALIEIVHTNERIACIELEKLRLESYRNMQNPENSWFPLSTQPESTYAALQ